MRDAIQLRNVIQLTLNPKSRRLYRHDTSRHTKAMDLLPFLQAGIKIEAHHQNLAGPKVTRKALFTVLVGCEYAGVPLITEAELEQILMRRPVEIPK